MTSPALAIASLAFLLAACTGPSVPPPVDITAVNYAYRAPLSVPPGPTRFRLVNAGTVPHEVQLFRFRLGISPDSARSLLALEHFPDSLADSAGAVLIAAPGTTAPEEIYADSACLRRCVWPGRPNWMEGYTIRLEVWIG
jgi:hypothetical protein